MMKSFVITISLVIASALGSPLSSPSSLFRSSRDALPKHIQRSVESSKSIVNELGTHKLAQLDEAIASLKDNRAPLTLWRDPYGNPTTSPYLKATLNLHLVSNRETLKQHWKSAASHIEQLRDSKHRSQHRAAQWKSDLYKVASWTREENDPHKTVRLSPLKGPNGTKARKLQLDPEERESEIARLEKEYQDVLTILARYKARRQISFNIDAKKVLAKMKSKLQALEYLRFPL